MTQSITIARVNANIHPMIELKIQICKYLYFKLFINEPEYAVELRLSISTELLDSFIFTIKSSSLLDVDIFEVLDSSPFLTLFPYFVPRGKITDRENNIAIPKVQNVMSDRSDNTRDEVSSTRCFEEYKAPNKLLFSAINTNDF